MKAIRTVLACIRKADRTYDLFHKGDKIALGISGGKDSMVLLYALNLYKKFSKCDYDIIPVTLDLGFDGFEGNNIREYVKSLGYNLHIEDNKDVYKILKIQQKKQNSNHLPCSICSRMKKASINKVAKELGCNKVAFAHHADDAIETYFMNMIYGGRIATFSPRMKLEKADVEFIRPLIYVREKDISKLIKEENIKVFDSHCPADKLTSREEIKSFLKDLYKKYPSSEESFLKMLFNYEKEDIWGKEIRYQLNEEGLILKPVLTPKEEKEVINIRYEVFEKELGISHHDEFIDDLTTENQFLIYLKDVPIGTLRYRFLKEKEIKIERVAMLKEYRGHGYMNLAINFITDYLKRIYTPCTLIIHSMEYVKDFYIKCGYELVSKDIYYEANIPHVTLKKEV